MINSYVELNRIDIKQTNDKYPFFIILPQLFNFTETALENMLLNE